MENKALITKISGENGSNIVARCKGGKWYTLTFKVKGDFRLQFYLTEEDSGNHLFTLNRCALVTTGGYKYTFRPSEDAILEFNMRHEGEVYDLVLVEKEEV